MTVPLASPPGRRPSPARRPHAPRVVAAGLAILVALSLAACGGAAQDGGVVSLVNPSASPDASSSPAASMDPEEAMLAFTKCMKEHGVDVQVSIVTDGTGGTGGTGGLQVGGDTKGEDPQPATAALDPKAMEAADKACRDLLPAGGMLGDPSATMDPALADQMLKFAQCMRDHGVDYPDPVFNGGAMSVEIGGSGDGAIDPSSQTFQAAQETCGKELPGGGPFVIGGSSSSSGSGTGPGTIVGP
jgi:hypothetical protein